MSDRPTSFHDFKWACGHVGPGFCKICRDEQIETNRVALEQKDETFQAMESVLAKIGERLKVSAGDVPALLEAIDQLTAGDSLPDDGEKQAAALSEIDR